ncbi:cytosolic phospholipase A2 zeta like protein [Zymoseptoria brevis]|uniref:Lysophospholipase n=1 Tax=Zymoseptoria brevis TaxID=1047168 RepID=A0A0F4GN53_9PEZI|nr:cytosolic phospholipase A2 zeta like protein [Zymoseptoria brevis]
MQRAVRNIHFQRLAWSVGGGSSVVVGYGLWSSRRPLLLDSSQNDLQTRSQSHESSIASTISGYFKSTPNPSDQDGKKNVKDPSGSSTQAPPRQTKGHKSPEDQLLDSSDDNGLSTWQKATGKSSAAFSSLSVWDISALTDRLTTLIVPAWIRKLPGLVNKLQNELSMKPWSLSWEIWEDAHDPQINPEILWEAKVRVSQDLCAEEQAFLDKRRRHTAKALARYLNIPESEIDPRDVPTIAMCGSGGGLRALVAGTSSYLSAHEAGLFDCVTYTAGVSGSCWLQTLYYSSIGQTSHQKLIDHLKQRLGVHIAYPPAALELLNHAPTNKFLLGGFVEKIRGVPDADLGLVDVYGLLLAARLMVPKGELRVSDYDMKVSNQKYFVEEGDQPMPIYTAVRHEIPDAPDDLSEAKAGRFSTKHNDYFQWFEWTPYEFFCDELNAGIPTWAVGRKFESGKTVWRENGLALPELRVPMMLGIWGSAFCATLAHYYREISPLIKASGLAKVDEMMTGKDEDLAKVHPIDPAVIPNFLLGLKEKLPASAPASIHKSSHLQLMDAGMSNNLPIYPLLRPGREVDVIIAFDASADVKTDNWIKVVDGYVRQRGIAGWPMGAGWPSGDESSREIKEDMELAEAASLTHSSATLDAARKMGTDKVEDLGHCTVWVGTTQERQEYMDDPPTRRLKHDCSDEWHIRRDDAGIALIYFPFTKNEKVPGVDPMKSEFMSTWNFVYTPEEIDSVVQLARANFDAGQEQTKRTIKAVWERKKAARLEKEKRELELRRAIRVRRGHAATWRNGDVGQGDQFGGV